MSRLNGFVLGVITFCTSAAALADDAAALRETQDRVAIEALMWRYVRALDTLDADAYAAVFTEDGSFGSGSTQRRGRAELSKMIMDLKKGRADREAAGQPPSPPMYHVIVNHQIEFVGANEARYHSYWMTVFGGAGQETPPRVAAAGRGVDTLVRVNGRWLIKNRNVAPQ
jgi:3-phenylpropionate/cinnamic acid dioxygenase small subunit